MRKFSNLTLSTMLAGALLTTGAAAQNSTSSTPSSASSNAASSTQTGQPASSQTQSGQAAGGAQAKAAPATPNIPGLPTKKDQISYAIGLNVGKGLHRESIDVDPNMILQGLKDALGGGKVLMTDEQAQQTLMQLQAEVRERENAKREKEGQENAKAGEAFLAANKSKPGVITLPDGLQYKMIKEGTGPKPTINDVVTVNYRGTLIDGKEFDSSYKRNEPATFPVRGVIKGWTEVLQLVPVGSKFELYLPPDLAYGEHGAPPDIGPNSTLVFEVDLLSIKPNDKPQGNPAAPAGADHPAGAEQHSEHQH